MKTITKASTLILLSIFLAGNTIQAQQGHPKGPPPSITLPQINKMVEELSKELSLSIKQKTKISEIYCSHYDKTNTLMKKQISKEVKRRKMEVLERKFISDVKSELTNVQKIKYDAYLKKQKSQRKNRR